MSAHNLRQQKALARFRSRALCWHVGEGRGWFRIFGVGLTWKDVSIHSLTLSQRNGYARYVKLGAWAISYLSRGTLNERLDPAPNWLFILLYSCVAVVVGAEIWGSL